MSALPSSLKWGRLEEPDTNRICFLIVMGALENGKKELLAILDGYRAGVSHPGWKSFSISKNEVSPRDRV